MNKLSATTVAALLVAVASTSAFAQEGSLTREEVRAEVLRAQAAGEFVVPKAEDYGVFVSARPAQQQKASETTTAAKTKDAARSESWYAEHNPQDYGVFLPTGTAARKSSEQFANAK